MSDEQKMPEVVYLYEEKDILGIPRLNSTRQPRPTDTPYLRCPDSVDPSTIAKGLADMATTIATLTAERDALQAKLDTIINYINSEETNEATGFWLKMLLGYEQAAQLKEQPND